MDELYQSFLSSRGPVLCLDVGSGTQDALLALPGLEVENWPRFVLPAPARLVGRRLLELKAQGRDVWLCGSNMGGGFLPQVRACLEAGVAVTASPGAAQALHNNPGKVRSLGVELAGRRPEGAAALPLGDYSPGFWTALLQAAGLPLPSLVLAAAQDHGFSGAEGNRTARMRRFAAMLEADPDPRSWIFDSPPPEMTRLAALAEATGGPVADTATAAVLGALADPGLRARSRREGVTFVNLGNGHVFAALLYRGLVRGVYEHHTDFRTREELLSDLAEFRRCFLPAEAVQASGGHGAAYGPLRGGGRLRAHLPLRPQAGAPRGPRPDDRPPRRDDAGRLPGPALGRLRTPGLPGLRAAQRTTSFTAPGREGGESMHDQPFDPAEFWSRDQIEATQLARLKDVVRRVHEKCPFYRKRLDEAGIGPDGIRSLDDVERIPFTTKDDLRSQYPMGLCIVPPEDLVRMHCSSGTTGTPVAIVHTRNDLNFWADLMARCMHMVGVTSRDVFQNMSGYGLFTGGLGIHMGAERLGCMTIPAGAGNTARQIKLMKDFKTTVAHILPSYALILAERVREMGEDPATLPLRIALVGAEPYTDAYRTRIEELLGIKVYNSYGLSEMNGPSVGFECKAQQGLHFWEDCYIVEVVDPDSGRRCGPGEIGELVMTSLCRESMPILRYRTRDLTRILPGECSCGRLHVRLDRILGRSDDMFICKGVNIYPQQVETVLMRFNEVGRNYLILLDNDGVGDVLRVKVEIHEETFVEDMRSLQGLQQRIARALRDEILVTPRVELVQNNSLPTTEGKAVRFQDVRNRK